VVSHTWEDKDVWLYWDVAILLSWLHNIPSCGHSWIVYIYAFLAELFTKVKGKFIIQHQRKSSKKTILNEKLTFDQEVLKGEIKFSTCKRVIWGIFNFFLCTYTQAAFSVNSSCFVYSFILETFSPHSIFPTKTILSSIKMTFCLRLNLKDEEVYACREGWNVQKAYSSFDRGHAESIFIWGWVHSCL